MGPLISTLSRYFCALALILAPLGLATVYINDYNSPPIRSDGVGYYAYLPALFIHKDLTMEKLAQQEFGGDIPAWTGIVRYPPTGRYLDKYTIGEAVMIAPLFLLAHTLSRFVHPHASGFAPHYQVAAVLAGLGYMVLGLWLLQRVLRRYFSEAVTLATLICILFGTNLYHYGTYDAIFSHAFSFCLFALLLYLLPGWYADPSTWRTLGLGAAMGLILLVRVPNALALLFVPAFAIRDGQSLRERLAFAWRHRWKVVLLLMVVAAVFAPQLAYWTYITGAPIVFPYQSGVPGKPERFYFTSPWIGSVLFSVRKGLFFWSPILLFAVPGLVLMARTAAPLFLPTVLFLPLNLYIVASWHAWPFGGSYGHRGFTESLAVLAVPLAVFFDSLRGRAARAAVAVLAAAFVALSVVQMLQYWKGIIPFDGTTWELYRSVFLRLSR